MSNSIVPQSFKPYSDDQLENAYGLALLNLKRMKEGLKRKQMVKMSYMLEQELEKRGALTKYDQ